MGASFFGYHDAAAILVSGLVRWRLHALFAGERFEYDVNAGGNDHGFFSAQFRGIGLWRRRDVRRRIWWRWWRRILKSGNSLSRWLGHPRLLRYFIENPQPHRQTSHSRILSFTYSSNRRSGEKRSVPRVGRLSIIQRRNS